MREPIRFNPASGWPRAGRAFNHGVVEPDGRRVHLTGQVAWDEHGAVEGAGDCEAQTKKCFENVRSILAAVGGRLEDIVSLTVYFVDSADLPVIQKVRADYFAPEKRAGEHLDWDTRPRLTGLAGGTCPNRRHPT